NAGDLARWAKLLWEGKVFSATSLAAVLDAKPTGTGRGGGKDASYGLAVQVQPSEFGVTYGHAGWFPGYQTEMVYFPEDKIGIALQVNSDPVRGAKRSPHACLMEIMRLVHSYRKASIGSTRHACSAKSAETSLGAADTSVFLRRGAWMGMKISGADPLVRGRRPRRPSGIEREFWSQLRTAGPGGPARTSGSAPQLFFKGVCATDLVTTHPI